MTFARRWAVLLWSIAAICLAGTLLFGVLAAIDFWIDHHLDNSGVTTSATVADVDDVGGAHPPHSR